MSRYVRLARSSAGRVGPLMNGLGAGNGAGAEAAASWTIVHDARSWDQEVTKSADVNVYQTSGWAEYRGRSGWRSERWAARLASGETVMLAQVLMRPIGPGVWIGWSPGGPLVGRRQTGSREISGILRQLVTALGRRGCVYIRFNSHLPLDPRIDHAFSQSLSRPSVRLTPGYSIRHDLREASDEIERRITPHHRYAIRRAFRLGLRCAVKNDTGAIDALARLYEEVRRGKGLPLPPIDLHQLRDALAGGTLLFVGSVGDEIITSWLVSSYAGRILPLVAATGAEGRRIGATYGLVAWMLRYLHDQGSIELDLGGVDPSPGAEGVNFFKLGFGGTLVEYLGEWDWARSGWVRPLASLAIRYRRPFRSMTSRRPGDPRS